MDFKHLMEKHKEFEKGQSLVEFTLFLIVLIWLVSGIFDVGRAIFMQFALQDAAEEGIVYGIAFPNECDLIKTRVWNSLEENRGISADRTLTPVSVTINGTACSPSLELEFRQMLKVQVSAPFTMTMPLLAGTTITLTGTANGTILRPPPPGS